MKRFLLFCYEHYEENGGWNDFIKDFDTFAEAQAEAERIGIKEGRDNFNIVDIVKGEAVDGAVNKIGVAWMEQPVKVV